MGEGKRVSSGHLVLGASLPAAPQASPGGLFCAPPARLCLGLWCSRSSTEPAPGVRTAGVMTPALRFCPDTSVRAPVPWHQPLISHLVSSLRPSVCSAD